MNRGVGIHRLELDLFDSARRVPNSFFFDNFGGTSTDSVVSGIDVVIENLMRFMIAIRNAIN